MTIGLAMITKDAAKTAPAVLRSAKPFVSHWTVLDTGSTDDTPDVVCEVMEGVPGAVFQREWAGFGEARSTCLAEASQHTDWVLMLDADMTLDAHPLWYDWFLADPDPSVDAWQISVKEPSVTYRLPLLTRSGPPWRYVGKTHEYLDPAGRRQRQLNGADAGGLTVNHVTSKTRAEYERDLDLLKDSDDPRGVFYLARTLDCLGRTDEAVEQYRRRASMGGFEEEAWYAAYSAAKLTADTEALLACYEARPWRTEPLRRLLEITEDLPRLGWPQQDVLFVETVSP